MSASGNYAEDEDLEDPYAASDPETLTSRLLAERSLSEGGADGFGGVGSIAAAVKTVLEEGQHETGNSSSIAKPPAAPTWTKAFMLPQLVGDYNAGEFEALIHLAAPAMLSSCFGETLGVVSMLFIGRLGPDSLSAATLALMFTNCTGHAVLWGLSGALDTQCSQAWGAGNRKKVGIFYQRAVLILTVLCFPIMWLWWNCTTPLLQLLQIGGDGGEGQFARILCLGFWPITMVRVTGKWLQAQGHFKPSLVASIVMWVFNPFLHWVLIFKLGWGFQGAAYAQALTCWIGLATLLAFIMWFKLHEETWSQPKLSLLLSDWTPFFLLGGPAAGMLCMEWWSWEFEIALAGRAGKTQLAAQSIVMQICVMYYVTLPMGLSQAVAMRVGNLVGAGQQDTARRSAWVGIKLAFGVMLVVATILFGYRSKEGRLFTDDNAVVETTAAILTVVPLFAVLDGTACVMQGVIRGLGDQKVGAIGNFVAYYVVGLPLGWMMCFKWGHGVTGLWDGMLAGLAVADAIFVWCICRSDWKPKDS